MDRIVMKADVVRDAAMRLRQTSRALDELSVALAGARRTLEGEMTRSVLRDDLERCRRGLQNVGEDARTVAVRLETALEDFLGCEHSVIRDLKNLADTPPVERPQGAERDGGEDARTPFL